MTDGSGGSVEAGEIADLAAVQAADGAGGLLLRG